MSRGLRPVRPALSLFFIGILLTTGSALLGCEREQPASPVGVPSSLPSRGGMEIRRIVSLAPAASLFVRAIGAEADLVGLDPESLRLLGRVDLPPVGLADSIGLDPDLVLTPAIRVDDSAGVEALRASGASVIEFAPHDLDDLLSLVRDVGPGMVGRAAAVRFELSVSRPLAEVGGASFGELRPRVAPIVGIDPLELAGGHSFETDLIEIAGGSSLTHGGEDTRIRPGLDDPLLREPDLYVHFGAVEPGPAARRRLRSVLPREIPLVFFQIDVERFWLEAPADEARRLRRTILSSAIPASALPENGESPSRMSAGTPPPAGSGSGAVASGGSKP